eukprot:12128879-Alexandrium_andersonii.AAC.1
MNRDSTVASANTCQAPNAFKVLRQNLTGSGSSRSQRCCGAVRSARWPHLTRGLDVSAPVGQRQSAELLNAHHQGPRKECQLRAGLGCQAHRP